MQGCVGLCRSVCRTMQVYVGPKKIRPFGPQFGLKIREGGGGGVGQILDPPLTSLPWAT